jgi:hypothetical protein
MTPPSLPHESLEPVKPVPGNPLVSALNRAKSSISSAILSARQSAAEVEAELIHENQVCEDFLRLRKGVADRLENFEFFKTQVAAVVVTREQAVQNLLLGMAARDGAKHFFQADATRLAVALAAAEFGPLLVAAYEKVLLAGLDSELTAFTAKNAGILKKHNLL